VQVVMVAAECLPFAQAGGLGDVVASLPVELQKLGAELSIIIPRYRAIDLHRFGFQPHARRGTVSVGLEQLSYDVHVGVLPGSSIKVFLLGNDRFFGRDGLYFDPQSGKDFPDQPDRWIFFNRAAMDFIQQELAGVDVIHCHDHQAALIPAYLRRFYRRPQALPRARCVYTIHNLGYQGLFPREVTWRAGFDDGEFYPASPFEFYGAFNFMKVGIVYADAITTVSPTYAREIQDSKEYGYGLEGVLRERRRDLTGILNGIDVTAWNPAADPWIPQPYDAQRLEGKRANKRALLHEFGFDRLNDNADDAGNTGDDRRPLLAMISRIDVQKGFDLVVTILDQLLRRDVRFVLLGTGNKETEAYLQTVIDRHPRKAAIRFAFEPRMSHLTEAGADIFLMPSKYEPCGLNQMYSLRYGTVPVVRTTGGLADTVSEFQPQTGEGVGFRFYDYDADQFAAAIDRALAVWEDRTLWEKLMRNGMAQDFSWSRSAAKYMELYTRFGKSPSDF
jgi:starch synthase